MRRVAFLRRKACRSRKHPAQLGLQRAIAGRLPEERDRPSSREDERERRLSHHTPARIIRGIVIPCACVESGGMAVDRRPKFLAFAVCLTASSMVSSPQLNKLPISDAPYPLDTVKVLSCVFPVSVETAWQNGEPRPEIAHRGDALALTFDQID